MIEEGHARGTAEAESGGSSTELFTVVVTGAMNPAIHHPSWYQQHQLLSQAEASEALSSGSVTGPILARLTFASCEIFCVQQEWRIRTSSSALHQRVVEIAAKTFDELLRHTPVSSFAFSHGSYHGTDSEVGPALVGMAMRGGFPALPDLTEASVAFQVHSATGQRASLRIEPSLRSPREVFVHVEHAHPIQREAGQEFLLQPLLAQFYDADVSESRAYSSAVVEALNRVGEEA